MTEILPSAANLAAGLAAVFSASGLLALVAGTAAGIAVGAVPGLSPSTGVALMIPFSYGLDPAVAFIFFTALYQSANYGGSITAIAINTPGTPSSVVTAIDGYKLTLKGKTGQALNTAVLASSFGGFIGAVILIFFAKPVSRIGLGFGPAEYCCLAFFGLTTVVVFGRDIMLKALLALLLGLFLSTVGLDPFTGDPRFCFGIIELYDGIPFIPAMIGLFAIGEVFYQTEYAYNKKIESPQFSTASFLPALNALLKSKLNVIRSSLIGTFIGIMPGAGATIASFVSYGLARSGSFAPEEFGQGSLEGITASEAANSSSVGGALVPLLSLGIPGSATSAVLLGALTLHGLAAGPELFITSPEVVYGIFTALLLSNVLILVFGFFGNKIWFKATQISKDILFPLIISAAVLGSFSINNSLFDVWLCLGFGVVGWIFKRSGYPAAALVLGLVLGEMIEINFRRAILMGGMGTFTASPIALILIALSIVPAVAAVSRGYRGKSSVSN